MIFLLFRKRFWKKAEKSMMTRGDKYLITNDGIFLVLVFKHNKNTIKIAIFFQILTIILAYQRSWKFRKTAPLPTVNQSSLQVSKIQTTNFRRYLKPSNSIIFRLRILYVFLHKIEKLIKCQTYASDSSPDVKIELTSTINTTDSKTLKKLTSSKQDKIIQKEKNMNKIHVKKLLDCFPCSILFYFILSAILVNMNFQQLQCATTKTLISSTNLTI
jgi:hypothetical protein